MVATALCIRILVVHRHYRTSRLGEIKELRFDFRFTLSQRASSLASKKQMPIKTCALVPYMAQFICATLAPA